MGLLHAPNGVDFQALQLNASDPHERRRNLLLQQRRRGCPPATATGCVADLVQAVRTCASGGCNEFIWLSNLVRRCTFLSTAAAAASRCSSAAAQQRAAGSCSCSLTRLGLVQFFIAGDLPFLARHAAGKLLLKENSANNWH